MQDNTNGAMVVKTARARRVLVAVSAPLVGAILAVAVAHMVGYAVELNIVDASALFGIDLHHFLTALVAAAIGALGGVIVAAAMLAEALRARVSPIEIMLAWDDARLCVPRRLIRHITIGSDLIIFGERGIELARVRNDLDTTALRRALQAAGYRNVSDLDPYATAFSAATDCPVLNGAIRQLLQARANALTNRAYGDAEQLRRRLAAMGVVVRDVHRPGRRGARQEWRLLAAADTAVPPARNVAA